MKTSLFDIFKIGIGPSSSHTVGPMSAARCFALQLQAGGEFEAVKQVRAELYGSLALTGKGHGTDRAIVLGLAGEEPHNVDPAQTEAKLQAVRMKSTLDLLGRHEIPFVIEKDVVFHSGLQLPLHSNGMEFTAFSSSGEILMTRRFYSIGGGFIVGDGVPKPEIAEVTAPHEFRSAIELLSTCEQSHLSIWKLMFENECAFRSAEDVRSGIDRIWETMQHAIEQGMKANGFLPGSLNVRRRAKGLAEHLLSKSEDDPLAALDWISIYAIAVNEENAAGGRVVTAPTNGAAGIIPAVARYYLDFCPGASHEGLQRFFLTAAAIGILYKENASISGAEVGCQGEVGVAASMAAGGLVAALSGTNRQVEHAAEIAMEHHLGMTCDPVGGLVQIPCIERNAMGAVKAVNACRMAMNETGSHKISLDQVIQTMYRTGLDMQSRYKETSLAGLALNVIEC